MSGAADAGSDARACGDCTLCCHVLRVDEIGKLGGEDCAHQGTTGGCAIYATRPQVCRGYRCLWLKGGLDPGDRPDKLGAVLDLLQPGAQPTLHIREAAVGTFDRSARLQVIAARFRSSMPVRISDTSDVLDADREVRVLLPNETEERLRGEQVETFRDGELVARRRLPWLERTLRRTTLGIQRLKLRRFSARAERFRARDEG